MLRTSSLIAIAFSLLLTATLRAEPMYGTNGAALTSFDTASPLITSSVPITGMQTGETLVGIDLRPATGVLYGLGSSSRLYTINPTTGVATQVGTSGAFTLSGTGFGMDFNPVVDRIRVVSNTEQNIRLNPNDGSLTATDTALNPAGNVVAAAYTNNFAGASSTTLYGIDSAAGTLVLIGSLNGSPLSPNTGAVTPVGSLGLGTNLQQGIGFDISALSGIAYAMIPGLPVPGIEGITLVSRLYTINLATGAATLVGTIGVPGLVGITAATAVPEPSTYALIATFGMLALAHRARRARK